MKQRCNNPENAEYDLYGGRCISYVSGWERYRKFYEDMHFTWFPGAYLDRINNNLGYSPDNCRWVTPKESGRNTRAVKLSIEKAREIREIYSSGTSSYRKLAKQFGVHRLTIQSVIQGKRWAE